MIGVNRPRVSPMTGQGSRAVGPRSVVLEGGLLMSVAGNAGDQAAESQSRTDDAVIASLAMRVIPPRVRRA